MQTTMPVEESEKEKGGGNKNCLTTRERCMNITHAVNATENPKPCGLVRCRAYFFLLPAVYPFFVNVR